ncbi:uncharacterized protein LOC134817369 [Bolinopsis microptera]|uniref:uncharacterized protein LOC134817369 n=1 Tax=Bolinopsis microptera TaxID=2820187 RepID=UPI00307955CC
MFRAVNVYCPTNTKSELRPEIVRKLYKQVSSAIVVPSRHELFVMGDFNGRLGKLDDSDYVNGVSDYVGRHGMGKRNHNGHYLLNFMCRNDLFAANTAFLHRASHRTTYEGLVNVKGQSGKKHKVFTQIDYILCKRRSKCLLRDARSHNGMVFSSDHRLVICTIELSKRPLFYAKAPKRPKMFDTRRLTSDPDCKRMYEHDIASRLSTVIPSGDPNKDFAVVLGEVHKSAAETLGYRKAKNKCFFSNDPTVVALVAERHDIRLALASTNKPCDSSVLRGRRNKLGKDIKKRLKELECAKADQLAEEISSTDDTRQMFEAVRSLAKTKETKPIVVHNKDGYPIGTDLAKAEVLRDWYEEQLTGDEPALDPFEGPPSPLDCPITEYEVKTAAKRLKNGKANGPDNTPNELLKYGGSALCVHYAKIINTCFEENLFLDAVGECFITPLQKPGKTPGELKSLRPLTLCNCARKLLSLITLRRIEAKVDAYTGPWQAAYKQKRSCGDLVWCHRMLISIVKEREWSFHKMGLDMSSAFDTISRQTVLNLLDDAGCTRDEIRLVRFLLSNTKIKVRVNNATSLEFISTNGGPQGDSVSGLCFTITLAGACYHLRAVTLRPTPPISPSGMPEEDAYSDDIEYLGEDKDALEALLPVATKVFKEWNLNINESKTEFVHVYIAGKDEVMDDGKPLRMNEEWCSSKLLGSLLESRKDVTRRIMLANVAFQNFKKVWCQSKIPLQKKLKVYEAQVVSILMYNSSCWGMPKSYWDKLDACHRNHLRKIMNVSWPRSMMSKDTLYKQSNSTPMSERAELSRWKMLGHILRSDERSPAQAALCFAVEMCSEVGRLGAHRRNLLHHLKVDLWKRFILLESYDDILHLRELASNRGYWSKLFDFILEYKSI